LGSLEADSVPSVARREECSDVWSEQRDNDLV
jgi:hypothetical protein